MTPAERQVAGMRCSEVLARLSDYLDGQLPPQTVAQVNGHLAACEWCERFGERLSGIVRDLRRELRTPAPLDESVAERLRRRIKTGSDEGC